jgi:hypothetical protein
MVPSKPIDAALQITAKANRLDDMIRGSTSRTFGRAIAAIRDFCQAP